MDRRNRKHDELRDSVALFHFIIVCGVKVHESDHPLTTVSGVEESGSVYARDPVLGGQAAWRTPASPGSLRDRPRQGGPPQGATSAGANRARFNCNEIASRV